MHVLCTGAAGMIGRKLTARLANDGALGGRAISRLTLVDIAAPERPAGGGSGHRHRRGRSRKPGAAERRSPPGRT